MRDMIKPTLALLVICFVVALGLAFVNGLTKDTIVERAKQDALEQRMQVMKEAKSFELIEGWADGSGLIQEVYSAYDGENLVGFVFSAVPKGYGGEMKVTVGVGIDKTITGIKVGDNKETPGLGTKAAEDGYEAQYFGIKITKPLLLVKRPVTEENEIQAISGATISSKAVTSAVQACADLGVMLLQEVESK
ncbi:MAG: FMN-binding protein [Vallitaleaceae bacterium]|nr:FMN-binding protein [Vallitaleaceae bacterium]